MKVEASKFTEVGYVGRDVESMVRDLVDNADRHGARPSVRRMSKTSRNERVDERLLDLLLPARLGREPERRNAGEPRVRHSRPLRRAGWRMHRVSSSATCTHDANADARERYKRTRDKLRKLLLLTASSRSARSRSRSRSRGPDARHDGAQGAPEGMDNFTEMLQEMLPKRKKKRTVTVAEARRILLRGGARQAHRPGRRHQRRARARREHWASSSSTRSTRSPASAARRGGPDVSREGVQRDLLPIVEGSNVQTKYGMVQDRPRAVHRGRRVSRVQAERPDSGAAGPLSRFASS